LSNPAETKRRARVAKKRRDKHREGRRKGKGRTPVEDLWVFGEKKKKNKLWDRQSMGQDQTMERMTTASREDVEQT